MAREAEIGSATASDIAADMAEHRKTYVSFIRLLKYAAAGTAVILVIVFLLLL